MPYKKIYYTIHCPKCNKDYQVLPQAYFRKIKDEKYGNLCKSCRTKVQLEEMSDEEKNIMKQKLSEATKKRYNSLTDKQKQDYIRKRTEGTKRMWANMSEEERLKKSKKRSEDRINFLNTLTDDQKKEISNKISKTNLEKSANMSEEELAERKRKKQEERKQYWNSLTDQEKEEKINFLRKLNREYWDNITSEELEKRKNHYSKMMIDRWNDLTEKEQENVLINLNKGLKEWKESLSDEEKEERREFIRNIYNNLPASKKDELKKFNSNFMKEWHTNLSVEERAELSRKMFSYKDKISKLNIKFENAFNESHLVNNYYFKSEEVLTNNGVIHSWDYGIYSKDNNELIMVVDLDGSFFHGDNSDYSGLQSHEEYDEKRSLTVPSNIKHFIIQELNFSKCFELMLKTLIMNYDEYVDNMFKIFRSIPFPSPKFNDIELVKSYNDLIKMKCDDKYHKNISLNTRIGDRLIQHFHESIYQAHRKNKISPYEAWYDDKLLKECIQNRTIYQTHLNPNKILQGFNVSRVAPKVSVFSAGRAKLLISKYLNEFNEIFDPFSGFSGRMLGTVSLGKRYIGQDISEIHVRESNNIIKFLNENIKYFNVNNISATITQYNILESNGEYECLFTCPPYSDIEQWLDVPIDTRSCDDWIDECLSRFKCKKYLFVVDDTKKYKDYIVDEIRNRSHFGLNQEYIILIEK